MRYKCTSLRQKKGFMSNEKYFQNTIALGTLEVHVLGTLKSYCLKRELIIRNSSR